MRVNSLWAHLVKLALLVVLEKLVNQELPAHLVFLVILVHLVHLPMSDRSSLNSNNPKAGLRRALDPILSRSSRLKLDPLVHVVLPVLPVPLVLRDSKEFVVKLEKQDLSVLPEVEARVVSQASPAKTVNPEKMDNLDLLELPARPVLVAFRVCPVCQELRDTVVSPDWMVLKENLDQAEKKERKD